MLLFLAGAVYSRSGYAEMGADVDGSNLNGSDGLIMRLLGDGNTFTCILTTS